MEWLERLLRNRDKDNPHTITSRPNHGLWVDEHGRWVDEAAILADVQTAEQLNDYRRHWLNQSVSLPAATAAAVQPPEKPQPPEMISFDPPEMISFDLSVGSGSPAYGVFETSATWKGFRKPGGPYPREFDRTKHRLLREEFEIDIAGEMTCTLAWSIPPGSPPSTDLSYAEWQAQVSAYVYGEMQGMNIPGDAYLDLTNWGNATTVEPEREPLPEVEIMIKYVKHSKQKVRTGCKHCGTTDLFWAHELPEGVIVTGDEEDYCARCESTGALQLVNSVKTPTGKYQPHNCTVQSRPQQDGPEPEETDAEVAALSADDDSSDILDGIPDEDAPQQGCAQSGCTKAVPPGSNSSYCPEHRFGPAALGEPDPVGSGSTAQDDPWLSEDAPTEEMPAEPPQECAADMSGNNQHELDASGTCMNCGEDIDPNHADAPKPEQPHTHPEYVTKPQMNGAFQKFKGDQDNELQILFNAQRQYVDQAVAGVEAGIRPVEVSVSHDNAPAKPLPGLHHFALPNCIKMLSARLHVLMVGEKGVGKGKIARQAAEALNLPFYALPGSLSPQTPVSALIGYMNSSGQYIGTLFREAFEHGGVMFLDELDNAHPACMAAANDALAIGAGEMLAFPDGMVAKHPDFVVVAAANTFGRGPDQQYAARQRGDAATWDRFCMLIVGIDEPLEMTLCSRTGASATVVSEVLRFVRTLRKECERNRMPMLYGPRTTIDLCKLLHIGVDVATSVDSRVRRGMSDQDWLKITEEVRDIEIEGVS